MLSFVFKKALPEQNEYNNYLVTLQQMATLHYVEDVNLIFAFIGEYETPEMQKASLETIILLAKVRKLIG